jgi:hypothetical protein
MWPYAVVDYNLTLCRRQSRLQHIYQWQPNARVYFIPICHQQYLTDSFQSLKPTTFDTVFIYVVFEAINLIAAYAELMAIIIRDECPCWTAVYAVQA